MSARTITATSLAAMLQAPDAPVLLDIRDPVEADRGHVPGATSLPRRRLEFRIASLVRDRSTPIVVYGDRDPRAEHAATTLSRLGYRNVTRLDGGLQAWRAAGGSLATGNNVPSKRFGEHVQHDRGVPSIDAQTLLAWQREGRRIAICDVRTPEEHRDACIPGAVSAPSFDIALAALDLAERHETVVLHCAGRTRSIIATQTLVEMGIDNAVALENGTMGWRLAGLGLDGGSARTVDRASAASIDRAERRASTLADAAGVRRIAPDALERLIADAGNNLYVFDVRSVAEYATGHVPGSLALPGGQAVQRADDFIAVRGAPIVLVDGREARANLTATWLRRMGFADVSVLAGGIDAWKASGRPTVTGRERAPPLGWDDAASAAPALSVADARRWLWSLLLARGPGAAIDHLREVARRDGWPRALRSDLVGALLPKTRRLRRSLPPWLTLEASRWPT